ncbi:hypothetical protein GOP47_0000483 [Adiantum capillus-veneris]|nr:hypothetical protein GOP47_0000483 [Adiantum capillus-veneris]
MFQCYGPIIFLKLGYHVNVVATDDPVIMREIMGKQDDVFSSRPRSIATDFLCYYGHDLAFAPMGPHWKTLRRICMEHLLTSKRLLSYRRQRQEEVMLMVQEIFALSMQGKVILLRKFLGAFSMNCITRMLLGKRFFGPAQSCRPEEAARFEKIIHESMVLLGLFNIGDYLPILRPFDLQGYERRARKAFASVDALQSELLNEHKLKKQRGDEDGGTTNFIDVLLSLREAGEEKLTDQTIKAIVQDVIAAGTDTSSATNEWAMAQLLRHPNVCKKAQEELDRVVGRERLVEEEDLPQLRYLRCIAMETMRLTPSGPFVIPHYSTKDTQLAGYDVPKGTQILISIYSHARNKKVWGKDAEVFYPERHWTDETKIENSNGLDMKHVMFGGGRRRCPGAALGLNLVMLALGHLLQCFDWSLPPNVVEIDMSEVAGLAAAPATPLQAIATPRLAIPLYNLPNP